MLSTFRRLTTNLANRIGGEFRFALALAAVATVLCSHVGHVVGLRSQEQVDGIDASRVVASVADKHPTWDWADHQFVGDARGDEHHAATPAFTDLAMPPVLCRSRPQDAAVWLLFSDPIKKAVNEWAATVELRHAVSSDQDSVWGGVLSHVTNNYTRAKLAGAGRSVLI